MHEIQPHAAGATSEQFTRLVDEVLRYGRDGNPTYPHTQAMIDASVMLERAEAAGLRVIDEVEREVLVAEGWWHPNVKSGQIHDHTERTMQTMHRLCEPVYTRREAP